MGCGGGGGGGRSSTALNLNSITDTDVYTKRVREFEILRVWVVLESMEDVTENWSGEDKVGA